MYFSTIEISLKLLNFTGSNPAKGYGKLQIFLFLGNMLGVLSVLYLMVLRYAYEEKTMSISDFVYDVSCVFLYVHGMLKTTTMFVKKAEILKLLDETNHFWSDEDLENNSRIYQLVKKDQNAIRNVVRFMFTMNSLTGSGFLAEAFFSSEDILPARCYRPEWLDYYLLLFWQELFSLLVVLFSISAMDFIFMTVVQLTKIQYRMLNREMENLFEGLEGKNLVEIKNIVDGRMKRCVDHHNYLLRYGHQINQTFSMSIFLFLIIIILSMCVEMYSLSIESEWEARIRAMVYTATMCTDFMVFYCYPCQDLLDETAKISNSVYLSRWYEHLKYGRHVLTIINRGQRNQPIKAGEFSNLDLGTGLSTLQTMVSYSMFLRTVSGVEN